MGRRSAGVPRVLPAGLKRHCWVSAWHNRSEGGHTIMVTEDCNCRIPPGSVKAQRVSGGSAAGRWGTARVGDWVILPRSVVDAHPSRWRVKGENTPEAPERPAAAPEDPVGVLAGEWVVEARRGGVVPLEDSPEEP